MQYKHAKAKIIPIVRAGLINEITRKQFCSSVIALFNKLT